MSSVCISESITYLCNLSIKTGMFPDKWKEAKVKPLHKSGPKDDLNNYRPISILPVLSKLFERHVHDSLSCFLDRYKLMFKLQFGFRSNHSCETALVSMIDRWLKALNNGDLVGIVLIDFRKAFDLIDHQLLLKKLKMYKINQNALKWFESYLSMRKQKVSIDSSTSQEKIVKYGVPQGSILGPLLFLLFIIDLPLHLKVHTDLYADDTTLYEINSSKDIIERNLQNALTVLSKWCEHNGMVINLDKTKVMLITTRQKRNRIANDNLHITLDDVELQVISSEKILGVQVDNNLLWADHINNITKKMSKNIWLLGRVKELLSVEHRILFYKSYIQPHVDYCNIIWGNCAKGNLIKVERLQKRACRIILDYNIDNVYDSTQAN